MNIQFQGNMRRLIIALMLLALPMVYSNASTQAEFPGTVSEWNGYKRHDFKFNDRDAIVVEPKAALAGRPWIWRPAFFNAFPSVDIALASLGYYVAYYDLTHLYGSPRAVKLGTEFYNAMVNDYGLNSKVIVEGFSRGGLFAVNWAAANPDCVACLYIDAPVCDIESWPGRKNQQLWNDFLKEWNFTGETLDVHKVNPLDHLKQIAKAKIPIIGVAGDSDKTVPYDENLELLAKRYHKLHGGKIQVILKAGCDHHPHSLEAPAPIVKFILDNAAFASLD
jgi:pimeloyl-ACP methyl ester carboxylesterase